MLRPRITYANVVATLALFVALGGSAYAVSKITGADVQDRSLTSRDLRSNSANGRVVNERSLGPVPRAQNSARLAGKPATRFLVSCPAGTITAADVCVEVQAHPPASYRTAAFDCSSIDSNERIGRRLPTHQELMLALASSEVTLAPGGELTGEVYPSGRPGKVDVLSVTEENGSVAIGPDDGSNAKSYRCVADPMN